jgi:hypothetical protein
MRNDMTQKSAKHPTVGKAATILGTTIKRLDTLYKEGKTPSVIIDNGRRRRYPPDALIQAKKALTESHKPASDNFQNIVLLTYFIGAAVALLVQPKIVSFLGASISLLLLNYLLKLLDTHVFHISDRFRKSSVLVTSVLIALFMGIGTVYAAPIVGEFIWENWVKNDDAGILQNTAETATPTIATNGSPTAMPESDRQRTGNASTAATEIFLLVTASPITSDVVSSVTPERDARVKSQSTKEISSLATPGPSSSISPTSVPPSTSGPTDQPPTSNPTVLPTEVTSIPPTPSRPDALYHNFDGQGECREQIFPTSGNPHGWLRGGCP